MAEILYAFQEEAKHPILELRAQALKRILGLVRAAESAHVVVVRRADTDEPLHFGERRPSATEVIRDEMEIAGELTFRELSAIAHASPNALLRQTEVVPAHEGLPGIQPRNIRRTSLTRPAAPLSAVVPKLAVVWQSYMKALEDKMELYGWDRIHLRVWSVQAGAEMIRLLSLNEEQNSPR